MKLPAEPVAVPPRPLKRVALVLAFLLLVSGVGAAVIMCLLAEKVDPRWLLSEEPDSFALVIGILLVPQVLLLAGAPSPPRIRPQRRRSMLVSIAGGSLLAGGLTFGLIASILSLVNRWDSFGDTLDNALGNFAWIVLLTPWALWFVIFAFLWTGQWLAVFRRMYRLIIAGTVLELLVTIPIDVKVRRQTQCYCGEGTFWALAIGMGAAFCTFGPGMVLLYAARWRQRTKGPPICATCGYDLRGLPDNRCPECGTPFDPGMHLPLPLNVP